MIVRELLALIGFEIDEKSLLKAENAFEAIATAAFKLDLTIQKIGNISTAAMQELEYSARQSGVSVENLGQRMAYLGRAVNEAIYRGGRPGQAFYQMFGADAIPMLKKELGPGGGGLPAILGLVADKFNLMTDATKKDAIAIGLFSQGGAQLVPWLSQGSAGIIKMGAELHKTGAFMSEDMIKKGEILYHLLVQLEYTFKGLAIAIVGPYLERFTRLTAMFTTWIQQHRQIIAYRIGNVIEAIGKAFEFAAIMAERFSIAFALIAGSIFAAMFPMTAFFSALFIIAEDLYGYFALGDKHSLTYLIILAFEVLKKRLGEMSIGEIIATAFDKGLESAKAFFTYLEDKTRLGTKDQYGRQLGVAGQWLQFINTLPGVKQLVTSMGVNPEDPSIYADLFSSSTPQLPYSPLGPGAVDQAASMSGGFVVHQINFYGDATPAVAEDFVHKLEYWWDSKTRAATRH